MHMGVCPPPLTVAVYSIRFGMQLRWPGLQVSMRRDFRGDMYAGCSTTRLKRGRTEIESSQRRLHERLEEPYSTLFVNANFLCLSRCLSHFGTPWAAKPIRQPLGTLPSAIALCIHPHTHCHFPMYRTISSNQACSDGLSSLRFPNA